MHLQNCIHQKRASFFLLTQRCHLVWQPWPWVTPQPTPPFSLCSFLADHSADFTLSLLCVPLRLMIGEEQQDVKEPFLFTTGLGLQPWLLFFTHLMTCGQKLHKPSEPQVSHLSHEDW